jgi:hypothetical protein
MVHQYYEGSIRKYDSSGALVGTISSPEVRSPRFLAIRAIPEPGVVALAALGTLLLGFRRRQHSAQ